MTLGHQLDRLLPALSGRERAILVLRNFKEGRSQDHSLARGMSTHDHSEYNRLIGVMNACNCEIGALLLLLSKSVESLELREAWLFTMHVWQVNQAAIDFAVTSLIKEPITQSEHEALKESEGHKYAPIGQLATIVATEQRGWKDEDLKQVEWCGDSVVKDEAWKRLQAEAEAELRDAVSKGELKARGEGKKLQVEVGSFNELVGEPWGVRPKWVDDYEVRPDDEAGRVEGDRRMLAHLQESVQQSFLARMVTGHSGDPLTLAELVKGLEEVLCFGARDSWQELLAMDTVLEEVTTHEFNGEDVLKPKLRQLAEMTREQLTKLGRVLTKYDTAFEFGEPPEETMEHLRELIHKSAAR